MRMMKMMIALYSNKININKNNNNNQDIWTVSVCKCDNSANSNS